MFLIIMQFKQTMKKFFSVPTAKGLGGARRGAMMLLATFLFTMTVQTAWAAEWPAYITDVVLAGGTESEATTVKNSDTYKDYTWCAQRMNEGSGADIIYIGYKTSTSANTNGGYITDFIIIDTGEGTQAHNPPSELEFQGHTYNLCPAAGGNYFVNSNHGNLTSQASKGWNMYLYYTKENFSDKRAVSSITITEGKSTQSGALNLYYKDGTLHENEISLNRGVSGTPFVYMHISTETKVNRPNPAPKTINSQTYDGSPKKLISSNYSNSNSGTVYYRVGNSGSYTSDVNSITATNADQYYVWYYSGANDYGNSSLDYRHYKVVKIVKSPNSDATVTCSNHFEGTATVPEIKGTNLSKGTITYKYSTSQNGTYTTTAPSEPGTYWVKATIASDNNCDEYTTAATSFNIIYDWRVHNSGENENDAYVISTIADLKYLAVWVNSGSNDYAGKFFKLGDNIAFDKSTENNFTPIGTRTNTITRPFKGTFDGQGKTISGLNINKPNNDYVGLFGYANGATIKNLIVDNSTITGKTSTGAILGNGGDNATVTNCRVTNTVAVSGDTQVGGILGGFATVRGCVSAAAVSGSSSVGGIIGKCTESIIANSLYTGTSINSDGIYKGAIVGSLDGQQNNLTANYYTADLACKASANSNDIKGARKAVVINTADGVTVTPTGDATTHNVSGITGYSGNNGIKYTVGNSTVTYAGATENVSLDITYNIEGFSVTGYNDGNGNALTHVSGNTYTLTMTANAPTVTPVGSDVWGITTAGRDGSAEHPYLITTTEGLDLLAKRVNGTDGYSANTFDGKYFELGNDITYSYEGLGNGESNYTAIGTSGHNFGGHFDGKGHTISGIRINATANNQGLFGFINGATVKNVTIGDTHITLGAENEGAGGIAAENCNGSIIENCHVLNDVTITAATNGSKGQWLGGIVGNTQNENSVIRGCTSAATVSGRSKVGAIAGVLNCGSSDPNSQKCYIENCLVLGATVSGTSDAGAIVGYKLRGTLTNNLFTGDTKVNGAAGSDINGATGAYEFTAATGAIGAEVNTYAAGTDYEGITVYENGLAYNGKYYCPSLWTGNGTEEDPYVIYNTQGLDKLASDVNGGISTYSGKYFALGNDIAYDKTVENNYTPIGENHWFSGTFDGQGHTINGIRISDTDDVAGVNIAIFGMVAGTVENLVVSDCRIEANNTIGGIVAKLNSGTIENCHVGNDVILSGHRYIGGIVSDMEGGTIIGCTSAATIICTKGNGMNARSLGGIVSSASEIAEDTPTLKDNLFTGTISGDLGEYIGAIVGKNISNAAMLTNNYHTLSGMGGIGNEDNATSTDVAGATIAYELPAANGAMGAKASTYAEDTDYEGITVYENGLAYNGKYYSPSPWSGSGTEEDPYVIYTTQGLDKLANDVNSGNSYGGKYFALGADIAYDKTTLTLDLDDEEGLDSNFPGIGSFINADIQNPFVGSLDGRGHTISGIVINRPNYQHVGLFGYAIGQYIKNLTLANSDLTGSQNVGAIAGEGGNSKIENCHVANDVTVRGTWSVGGIVGMRATLQGCTSAATVSGSKFVGGILGDGDGSTVRDCLYLGNGVTATDNCYVGAIVGSGDNAILENNYHTYNDYGGQGTDNSSTGIDTDGAHFAISSTDCQEAEFVIGDPRLAYAEGTSYEGIKPYTNGLEYNGCYYWHEVMEIALIDDGLNEEIIDDNYGNTVNVLLAGRTFRKDGKWSTIVLPFDVDLNDPASPLYGATIRTVTFTPANLENAISGTTLNFTFGEKLYEADVDNALMAGVPYLIRWDRPDDYEGNESMYDIVDPLFIGVKITYDNYGFYSGGGVVGFEGDYNCMEDVFTSYSEEYDVLLLGDDNNLHYATPEESLGACRACFLINRNQIGDLDFRLTDYVFDLGNGEMLSGSFFQPFVQGDVNGDHKVTPADAIMILYAYFGVVQQEFNRAAADLNGDGFITPADAIEALYRYFGAGGGNSNARSLRPTTNGGQEPE